MTSGKRRTIRLGGIYDEYFKHYRVPNDSFVGFVRGIMKENDPDNILGFLTGSIPQKTTSINETQERTNISPNNQPKQPLEVIKNELPITRKELIEQLQSKGLTPPEIMKQINKQFQ